MNRQKTATVYHRISKLVRIQEMKLSLQSHCGPDWQAQGCSWYLL